MQPDKITLIIFAGRTISSSIERTISLAERAIARDTIDRAMATGMIDRTIVATDSPEFAESLRSLPVIVEIDEGEFHFGARLREIIHRHDVERAFYLGAGSAPLLSTERIAGICQTLIASSSAVLANNFYSSDFVAFTPGAAVDLFEPPETDNNLAFLLHHRAGLPNMAVPKEAGTQMDVDTPTDLMVLSLHPGVGPHTRAFLQKSEIGVERLNQLMRVILNPSKEVLIAGRVGAQAWALLEKGFPCRTRVLSEERGMRASGRDARGEVRSILGDCLRSRGARGFFGMLAEMVDGALIDSRVLFEHFGLKPSASDRFYSDSLRPEDISDPFLRDFTEAAAISPVPVVLGGHSLVSGDLWALAEIASRWQSDGAGADWSAHPNDGTIITPRVGANAVIFDDQGKVLLTRREDNGLWCLPGGHMDLGEMLTDTVIRETEEETGLKVEVVRLAGVYSMPYPGFVYKDPLRQIVVATFICRPVGGELRLSNETTDAAYFDPDDLPPDMLPGHSIRIRDALSGKVVVR